MSTHYLAIHIGYGGRHIQVLTCLRTCLAVEIHDGIGRAGSLTAMGWISNGGPSFWKCQGRKPGDLHIHAIPFVCVISTIMSRQSVGVPLRVYCEPVMALLINAHRRRCLGSLCPICMTRNKLSGAQLTSFRLKRLRARWRTR